MKIDIVIQFDAEDRRILQDAFASIRIIDPDEVQIKAVHRVLNNKNIEVSWASDLLEAWSTLKTRIQEETDCKADPEWIKRTEQAVADGKTPLTRHPEQTVALLCDVRKGQLETVDAAIAVTQKAIDCASDRRCRCNKPNINQESIRGPGKVRMLHENYIYRRPALPDDQL